MYNRKIKKEIHCPIEHGLDILGGKWKSRILCVLAQRGTLRYGQLKEEMANVTDTVLSAALKEMLVDGLILRRQYDEVPLRVDYTLTPRGASAVPLLTAVAEWANGEVVKSTDYSTMPICTFCNFSDN